MPLATVLSLSQKLQLLMPLTSWTVASFQTDTPLPFLLQGPICKVNLSGACKPPECHTWKGWAEHPEPSGLRPTPPAPPGHPRPHFKVLLHGEPTCLLLCFWERGFLLQVAPQRISITQLVVLNLDGAALTSMTHQAAGARKGILLLSLQHSPDFLLTVIGRSLGSYNWWQN